MQIEYLNIDSIMPYENNPRRNDDAVKYIQNSIEKFGFKVPLVIDNNNVIVCGHTRYKAAKALGMESVPCIIADDLTDEQIKAFRLADNKTSEMAAWDFGLLEEELLALSELEIDMAEFGFMDATNIDVDGFFEETTPKESEPEEEKEIKCPHCGMYFAVD